MTVASLLKTNGAKLVRTKKHKVWRFPDGRIFTMPSTPSDSAHGDKNLLADLKKFLGLTKHETTVGERRERKTKRTRIRQRVAVESAPARKTMADDLKKLYAQLPKEKNFMPPGYTQAHAWLVGQRG